MQTWQLNEMCPERLELVLQEKKIVRCCNCDNVFRWVPCGVQDLFVEIQAVDEDLVLFAFTACANLKTKNKNELYIFGIYYQLLLKKNPNTHYISLIFHVLSMCIFILFFYKNISGSYFFNCELNKKTGKKNSQDFPIKDTFFVNKCVVYATYFVTF